MEEMFAVFPIYIYTTGNLVGSGCEEDLVLR